MNFGLFILLLIVVSIFFGFYYNNYLQNSELKISETSCLWNCNKIMETQSPIYNNIDECLEACKGGRKC